MKKTDIILGCFVLIPILCLIIPVPLVLLDVLFTANIGISMLVQMLYIQKTQYLIYAFFIFFAVGMVLHTIKAVAIKKYDRKTYGNTYILLCISLLSELPIIWMYRNSIAANQQEITGVVRTLIFILVLQTLLSAVVSFAYRKKK